MSAHWGAHEKVDIPCWESAVPADWLQRPAEANIPCTLVQDYAMLVQNIQALENSYLYDYEHPGFGTLKAVGLVAYFSKTASPGTWRAWTTYPDHPGSRRFHRWRDYPAACQQGGRLKGFPMVRQRVWSKMAMAALCSSRVFFVHPLRSLTGAHLSYADHDSRYNPSRPYCRDS